MRRLNLLLLCFIFCFYGCNDIIQNIAKSASQSSNTSSKAEYKAVKIQNTYQLSIPVYMKEYKNMHPEASLNYANLYKEAYTIVIHEPKQEFITLFKELGEYDNNNSVIENYLTVQTQYFKENIDNVQIQHYGLAKLKDYPAKQVKMYGTIEGVDLFYVSTFIEGKENIYMIMSWTLKNKADQLENTFERISDSFQLI